MNRVNKRRRIIIESATEAKDSYGEVIQTFATYATRFAKRQDLSGREYFQSNQTVSAVTSRFILRYDSLTKNITTKMRVNDGGVYYDIESVIDREDLHKDIILMVGLVK